MKKLILSIALLAGMTFVACSDDNDELIVAYAGCQICEIEYQEEFGVQDYEVCEDKDGYAYVNNANTNILAEQYFTLYCQNAYVAPPVTGTLPGTGGANCVTCASYQMGGQTIPAIEVCKGDNGNALLMGIDTGFPYDDYITTYETGTGVDCQ
jgi:hypothetical protein